MSNVAICVPGERIVYLTSVNTPDYEGDPDILINPDISMVEKVDVKYWKRVGDELYEMTQPEKDVVDADALQASKDDFLLDHITLGLLEIGNTKWAVDLTATEADLLTAIRDNITLG